MKSEVYIQSVIRRLSPTAQRVVVVELGNPWTREAAIRALWSPYPEQALAQIVAHRIATRMAPDAGLGIQAMTSGQFAKMRKAESADELATLRSAKSTAEIAAAKRSLSAVKKDTAEIIAAKRALAAAKKSKNKDAILAAAQALKDEYAEHKADIVAAQKSIKDEQVERKTEIADASAAYKNASNQWTKEKTTKEERKAVVAEIGKAGDHHHWEYKRDSKTGELIAISVKNKESGNFFSKVGRAVKPFVPIIIGVVGAVLAPFTGGASLAAAAVLSAAYSINQKRIATNKAKREGKAVAKQMQAQVNVESASLNKQLDDLFKQNPAIFAAAGITSAQWAGMSVDQKLAVVERINSGKMPSTAENVAAAADAQGGAPPASLPPDQPIASTISDSPFMTPEGSVDSKPAASGGGGGMLLLAGGAALVGATMLSGQHGHK